MRSARSSSSNSSGRTEMLEVLLAMQSISAQKQRAAVVIASVGLMCLVLLLPPLSNAIRQANPARTNRDRVTESSARKRQRSEFVPGEVLVRFKQHKACEGLVRIAMPNKTGGTRNL